MISKFVSDLLDRIIIEVKKDKNMDKVKQTIIDPLIYYSFKRMYPYLVITSIIFILTFILALLILLFLIRDQYKRTI